MIDVKNISKLYSAQKYGDQDDQSLKGVQNISFAIEEGEVFGLLGPNGAGKTTLIRVLMGFIKADSGQALISNLDCWKKSVAVKKLVGYLPGEINFFNRMSGKEFLNLMSGLHGDRPFHRERQTYLTKRLDLDVKQPIRKMSKGMKQKLGIIYALMLDASVLILDEPTSGLDPIMQKLFIELILEEKARGKTIFISSHLFPEVERTCDRAAIIRSGHLAAIENVKRLKQMQRRIFEITFADPAQAQHLYEQQLGPGKINGCQLSLEIEGDPNPLLHFLSQIGVKDFSQKPTGLEETFMHFYEEEECL